MKMRWYKYFLLFLILGASTILNGQVQNDSVFNWSTISSFTFTHVSPQQTGNTKIVRSLKPLQLFIFLSPECPISRSYTLTLNNLFAEFSSNVEFLGCISGKGFTHS